MWAEAFADQDATEESAEGAAEGAVEETTEETSTEETGEEEEKSEEDMWAEAFADQEATEEATEETAEGAVEETTEEAEEGAEDDEEGDEDDEEGEDDEEEGQEGEEDEEDDEEDAAAELGISEDDYPEDDDDEDYEEDEEDERIKIGPISVPATRTGKLMLAGGVLGLLVTAGGAYFAWQTFMPPELTEVAKPQAEVPEGLTPKPDDEQVPAAAPEEASGKVETKPEQVEKTAKPTVLGEVGEDTESEIAQELAKSKTLSESVEVVGEDSEGLLAALSPEAKMVKFSTIMPVAFDVNDIKVLSFTLEITFTDEASAQVMQSALPFFEETTVKTVEKFLSKKFYNDILYVKEKLEKRLQLAYNKKIDSDGRVKKIKFEEFLIQ